MKILCNGRKHDNDLNDKSYRRRSAVSTVVAAEMIRIALTVIVVITILMMVTMAKIEDKVQ